MFDNKELFKEAFISKLEMSYGKTFSESTPQEQYHTLGIMIREYISKNWIKTNQLYRETKTKQVYYLSIEFLLGRIMGSNVLNLGIQKVVEDGLEDLGISFSELETLEPDSALGNGGLGRLAACFMDSIASLELPGHGCGIRYKYGLFEQKIIDGVQVEYPEQWLQNGHVWEVRKADQAVMVPFWGEVQSYTDSDGRLGFRHIDTEPIMAVPYDIPVVGYQNETVNTLRLWNAEPAPAPYHRDIMRYKRDTELVSEFLYPDDTEDSGKILRLKQQYFLVSASLHTILKTYRKKNIPMSKLHEYVSIHINDTHPVLAIPELMRILLDEEKMSWEEAWEVTTKTISYTNHTTLSEALEKWSIRLFQPLLPRIFMIVNEINERFCQQLWELYPGEWQRIEDMAIIAHDQVKMAHLAIAGSHSINGVAHLHTEILKKREMNNFYQVFPEKFNNKTNGITHRRWLLKSNPGLSRLISQAIGDKWQIDPVYMKELERFSTDSSFLEELMKVKADNKKKLAKRIKEQNGITVNPDSIFDVQVKRLHAYKRQLLNVLHIMYLYNRMKEEPNFKPYPRTFIFGAKASPGYYYAKKIIKLINTVADKVNNDPDTKDYIKVVFLENYRVSLAEEIFPAAELSEQISTASKEASGTGNMKFMMNGALTIGTMDGANVEIFERVGEEHIFTFGLSSEEVMNYNAHGGYHSSEYYMLDRRIHQAVNQLINGFFPNTSGMFDMIYDSLLLENDQYFVLRDFGSYASTQEKVEASYQDKKKWNSSSVINIANSGFFSSDRTIQEYATDIWNVNPINQRNK
ncbi:glycogen/starch/alpha-glucan phosphorylase [Pradoshia sp. D12]|uniref:glycogen/starch/alpha-glucan phosphorylase n=1 Tax=Bacillaceae TaxID=186817 RepID=UPI00080AE47B|nr:MULTISPECIES: glycogen/starch/alpha-glucan phosphorylase [Bacillaceae]OCA81923.1 glycogen phosphorylase [Bacillus sp. FJAT-27986]QFK72599.1 glycogen/starch/alpha-glucan phosphorylase [Pradoshia sp. D12]TPF70657.1 glycogen/starch/alpha-glucan phosphorylase [Bacillus sp. D12]